MSTAPNEPCAHTKLYCNKVIVSRPNPSTTRSEIVQLETFVLQSETSSAAVCTSPLQNQVYALPGAFVEMIYRSLERTGPIV
jgi:hypothetical protein